MRTLYDWLFTLGFILAAPYYFFRLWRRGHWREGFGERFGQYSSKVKQALTNRRVVWIHGVSVGEANLAVLLTTALGERLPQHKFVVSTTTTTGMAELRRKLPATVQKVYFPIDRRAWVRRAFAVLRPEVVVLIEAEVWPNFIWHARRRRVPVVLVNARLSARSHRGYRRAGFLFSRLFRALSGVTVQTATDARRLAELGAREESISVVGSLKFEPAPPGEQRPLDVPRLLAQAGMRPGARVLLGGSTHDGEEAVLAEVFQRLQPRHPDLFLVLVPRHFERGRSVGSQLERRRVRFVYRSELSFGEPPQPGSADCLLVNSTGELRHFYPHATVVFVGKSLIGRGGQNPIEPAAAGRAIVFGPHMDNFGEIVPRFLEGQGAIQVESADELEKVVDELLRDESKRERLGRNAATVVEANRGALGRTVEVIAQALESGAGED